MNGCRARPGTGNLDKKATLHSSFSTVVSRTYQFLFQNSQQDCAFLPSIGMDSRATCSTRRPLRSGVREARGVDVMSLLVAADGGRNLSGEGPDGVSIPCTPWRMTEFGSHILVTCVSKIIQRKPPARTILSLGPMGNQTTLPLRRSLSARSSRNQSLDK